MLPMVPSPPTLPVTLRRLGTLATACLSLVASSGRAGELERAFDSPPHEARPWVFWYWLGGAVAEEGITADLEAMAANGLGGAYLMPLIEPGDEPLLDPPVDTLSPEFWRLVRHAASESDRLGLHLGMHAAAGFSLAGGPWIEPELSMQQVVWSHTRVSAAAPRRPVLDPPTAVGGFYRDIALLAFPTPGGDAVELPSPTLDASSGEDVRRLADPANEEPLRMEDPGWIRIRYDEAVTVRSLTVRPHGNNYQALRLTLEASDDGEEFRVVRRLTAPRHGWMAEGIPVTYALPPTTARCFRLVFDPEGSEPGAEDLDWAKWKPVLKLRSLELSAASRIEGFEGKSGRTWRISPATPPDSCEGQAIDPDRILDLGNTLAADGSLARDLPAGDWTVLRIGHTSTGTTNYLGAAAMGLEVDKLNAGAVELQFDRWFGEARRQLGPELSRRVLKVFHTDSWECGSQNWTPGFAEEFRSRRGYALTPWLPALAGYPVESAEGSERFLHDFRETIGELLAENFFGTLRRLTREQRLLSSAESIAPVMLGDGLRHHDFVDIPMGEFWLRSPTHDKPNDLLDAVSGGHLYGKRIIQAEAFTELRLQWDEHPAMLKPWADRHYALGVNRLAHHVFMHTPWVDRKPGVTLNGVGLVFQRGQTWWKAGKAWVDYPSRCQALLQQGRPVVDVAVFTGAEMPRRSLTPDRLVDVLPGIVGPDTIDRERVRLANHGQPRREEPPGVTASAGITDSRDWIDPLRGYAYDSINPDALIRLARVEDRSLVLPGGARYRVLVLPGPRRMDPRGDSVPAALREKLDEWSEQGLAIVRTPHTEPDFHSLGVAPDFLATEAPTGERAAAIAWTHRATEEGELYFVSNQQPAHRDLKLSLRANAGAVELWDPVTGRRTRAATFEVKEGRTELPLSLPAYGSRFIVVRPTGNEDPSPPSRLSPRNTPRLVPVQRLDGGWTARFPQRDEPVSYPRTIDSWTTHEEPEVRHFSGTARYERRFEWNPATASGPVFLDLGQVEQLAEVSLNGHPVGTAWTPPYRLDLGDRLRPGENELTVAVTNTWQNRLTAEAGLSPEDRRIWTNGPLPPADRPLAESGLLGPVVLLAESAGHRPSGPVLPIPEGLAGRAREVAPEAMQRIHDEVRTPFKYGVVLRPEEGEVIDCPNVFRHGDKWRMMFAANKDQQGYRTFLAESDDLLHWRRLGCVLDFPEAGWDRWQAAGGIALADPAWGGSSTLGTHEGRYWMSYLGGSQQGYETDPLSIGLASARDPGAVAAWSRSTANPVLCPSQPHARPFEAKTLYKSYILRDPDRSLGWPFVMFYNGKEEGGGGHEAIGLAVSDDLVEWHRMGDEPLIYNRGELPWAISGDAQVVRMDDLWVMFYFGAFWKPKAFDTFAASHDLVHWTKWDGPHLVEPSEPWDREFAHKPWLLKHDGVVYHFYCAVGEQGRVIALATSKDLGRAGR